MPRRRGLSIEDGPGVVPLQKPPKKERPPRRTIGVGVRVDHETYERATAEAHKQGRTLGEVIRSFLYMFGLGELPGDFPPKAPGEGVRAEKKRKRGGDE